MSDDLSQADTDPAPAPEPTPKPEPPAKVMGVPLGILVRGGTTSSAWDRQKAEQYAASDARRAEQDERFAAVAEAQGKPNIAAGMLSRELLGRTNPKVALEYCYRDSALNRECLSEIAIVAHPHDPDAIDMILTLVCPKCLERTGRQEDSQVMIRQSHRMWWLDTSRAGMWVNMVDGSAHAIAGTVTTQDRVRCSALGCTWTIRIDNSKVWEV